MDEELKTRDTTEGSMIAQDQAATFEPFSMPTEGDVANLSDDDIAASLGFHTTLSEPLLPQDEMTTAQDEGVQTADESPATAKDAADDPSSEGKPAEDPNKEQDKEIKDIRKELEDLKASIENDNGTKTTEDTAASE